MPKTYTPKELTHLKETILDGLWDGKSLIKIVKQISQSKGPTVHRSTVYEWLNPKSQYFDKEFSDVYQETREIQGDYNAEKVEDIANAVEDGKIEPNVGKVAMWGHVWSAGVKRPRKYGNKQFIEQKSDVTLTRQYYDLSCLSDEELEQY